MHRISIPVAILLAIGVVGWLAHSSRRDAPQPVAAVRPEPVRIESSEALSVDEARVAGPLPPVVGGQQLEILVQTSSGRGKDARPVPSIAFEVLRLGARFVERPGSFAAEPSYEAGAHVATGSTDDSGVAQVALPADVGVDERGSPNVLVRVVEPGYQQRSARAYVPREGGLPRARIFPARGATARGRVVDAGGAPVLAQVSAERWIEHVEVGRRLHGQAHASPLPDGRFELHLREDLFDVLLLAEAEGAGTGAQLGVDLPLAEPPQDLELIVAGAGALRGRVEGLDGRPLGGLPLLVRLAELDRGPLDASEPLVSVRRAEGRGRTEVQLTTDVAGRFDLRGLRGEPYVVRANLQDERAYGYDTVLTDRPVLAVDAEVVLRVAQPQLLVRLLDVEGNAWTGPEADVGRDTIWVREREGWPVVPRILVYPLTPPGTQPEVVGESLQGRTIEDGTASFSIEAGGRYLVSVQGQAFTAAPVTVEVPAGAARFDLEVRARPASGWGTVVPHVAMAPSGERGASFDVFLEDPLTGLRLCDLDSPRGGTAPLRAPQGRYRLVVEGVAPRDLFHGTIFRERAHGRAEIELDVRADAQIEVPIELGLGARIDLELTGEPNSGDRDAVARSQPWMLEPQNVSGLPERVASATVVLRRPQRGFEPVFRVIEITGSSAAGRHLEPNWPLGLRETSQVVSPGAWTLVARLPGGREVASDVVLRAGETTPVRLEFQP